MLTGSVVQPNILDGRSLWRCRGSLGPPTGDDRPERVGATCSLVVSCSLTSWMGGRFGGAGALRGLPPALASGGWSPLAWPTPHCYIVPSLHFHGLNPGWRAVSSVSGAFPDWRRDFPPKRVLARPMAFVLVAGEQSGGPAGHQHRWDLWIDDRWLPFRARCQGVRLVRVPLFRACRARWPPLGAVCRSPGIRRSLARSGCLWRTTLWEIQWGQSDGLGGLPGTPVALLEAG